MLLLPMQERAESMQRVLAVDLLHLMPRRAAMARKWRSSSTPARSGTPTATRSTTSSFLQDQPPRCNHHPR